MAMQPIAPWHRTSFERFLDEGLPHLLAERLPLAGYRVQRAGEHSCSVTVSLASSAGEAEETYSEIPQPDEEGFFWFEDGPRVVVPTASQEELDVAAIRCVGEQLYDYVKERLGCAPDDLPWDAALARAWLPLDAWIVEFLRERAQHLDTTNWLSRHTHLRRLIIPSGEKVVARGQRGRVCLFETPEGPNIGRVLTVALGAEIRGEKLVIIDERPEAGLGPSAASIPLLEHNDANRVLMGANMLRQWVVQGTPEPALVQTGSEPDAPGFWVGRNLLTAYVSWGGQTHGDGIVISESCARRYDLPHPLEPGDKMSNRHGTKGVVSEVLPDDEMPHLPDGTPVELVTSFAGMHVRMNHGQVLEAAWGRVARAEGAPVLAPPFAGPGADALRGRLATAGLPESGMETLRLGRDGPPLQRPSTVGWVYWGRLHHIARRKVKAYVQGGVGQIQGEMENRVLCDLGAYETVRGNLNTRASRREDADTLAARAAEGPIAHPPPPTPMFRALQDRLRVAGIEASLQGEELALRFAPPAEGALALAHPLPHPWLHERELTEIGAFGPVEAHEALSSRIAFYQSLVPDRSPGLSETYAALVAANDRLRRMLDSGMPESLLGEAQARLEDQVRALFNRLLTPVHMRFSERLAFSGRTVIAPGADLRIDQVGLAEEIAWTLYGPLVLRELGDRKAVDRRDERATRALDEAMARSWVIVNRAPSLKPTALLAFHPVRETSSAIRLHPLACDMLDADFDGDQVAVMLPLVEEAQREAGERLSVRAHLARDPGLIDALLPPLEALWGLANLGLSAEGRREIEELAGRAVAAPKGLVTRAALGEAMTALLQQKGPDQALAALERLAQRGFEAARASGASISPFIGESLCPAPQPKGEDPTRWAAYREELAEQILSSADYAEDDLGPQRIAVNIRERGRRHLPVLIGPLGPIADAEGRTVVVTHSRVEGWTAEEVYAGAAAAREGLARYARQWERFGHEARERAGGGSFTVLARARRAARPGIVFARAAASGEVDPLEDEESRLLVGLPVC